MIAARVLTELADRRVQLVGADAQTLNQIRDRGAWRPHGADRGRRDADRHLGYARHRRSGRGLVVAGQMGAYRAPGRADPDTHEDGQRLRRDDQGTADADQGPTPRTASTSTTTPILPPWASSPRRRARCMTRRIRELRHLHRVQRGDVEDRLHEQIRRELNA